MAGNSKAMGVAYRDQLVQGTSTNDNALQYDVGEYIQATVPSGSAVSVSTATPVTITSVVLTPGDWDLDGMIDFVPAATTSVTVWNASISATTNALSTQTGTSTFGSDGTVTINQAAAVPAALVGIQTYTVRVSLAVQTTIYLVAQSTFSISTMTAYGSLRARRVR